jgi:hypothetical protein
MRHKLLTISSLFLLAACAGPTYSLTSVPVGNQVATMNRGAAALVSAWPESTIVVRPVNADLAGNLALDIVLINNSPVAADFGTENVSASYDGQTWLPMKTYEQLKAQLDHRAFGAKLAVALLAGLDAYASSQSANYTGRGFVSTPYGTGVFRYSGTDPVAREIALNGAYARERNAFNAINAAHGDAVAELKVRALRTTTVGPAQMFGGVVVADEPNLDRDHATTVLVRVAFRNDVHVLQFQAHRAGVLPIPAVDLSSAPALSVETAHNIAPDTAVTPDNATVAKLTPAAASSVDLRDAPLASTQPACTDADRELVKLAKKNGYVYHSTCGI